MKAPRNKVLIVDDTPENLRVLGEILTKDGYEVRVANSGTQGLEIARSVGVDLILLDVMMPDLNGYEVCARLKKDSKTRDVPVIFLTALDSAEDEVKGLGLGAVDYISKPFKVELVRTRISNQLELHNARVELRRHNQELDQLVNERAKELAEAHRQLKTLDSAKYDFLQVIYHKLWGTESSFVSLASKCWSLTDPNLPDRASSLERYETSQRDLFDTVRNALLMTSGKPQSKTVTLSMLRPVILDRARQGGLRAEFLAPVGNGGDTPLAGERELLIQALGTMASAAAHLASPPTVKEEWAVLNATVALSWSGETASEDAAGLFRDSGIHPSAVGQALGLDLPLAVKILAVLGGSVSLELNASTWTIRVVLAQFK